MEEKPAYSFQGQDKGCAGKVEKHYAGVRLVGKRMRGLDLSNHQGAVAAPDKYQGLCSHESHLLQEPGSHKEAKPALKTIQHGTGESPTLPLYKGAIIIILLVTKQQGPPINSQLYIIHRWPNKNDIMHISQEPFGGPSMWTIFPSRAYFNYQTLPGKSRALENQRENDDVEMRTRSTYVCMELNKSSLRSLWQGSLYNIPHLSCYHLSSTQLV